MLFMCALDIETVERYPVRLAPGEPFLFKPFTMDALTHAGSKDPPLPDGPARSGQFSRRLRCSGSWAPRLGVGTAPREKVPRLSV